MKKDIEIKKWFIRFLESPKGRESAEILGVDDKGNEYRLRHEFYMNGEYHDVKYDIVYTEVKQVSK